MAWTTTAQIKAAVRSLLSMDPSAALASYWDELTANGNTEGYNHIRRVLAGRGYSPAQMDLWDERVQWNRRAGLYYAVADANLDDDRALMQIERLWEKLQLLESIPITIDGVAVEPGADGGGAGPNVSHGSFDTSEDTFTLDSEL